MNNFKRRPIRALIEVDSWVGKPVYGDLIRNGH